MNDNSVIRFSSVTKTYSIRERGFSALRDSLFGSFKRILDTRNLIKSDSSFSGNNTIHAVDNISFKVGKGEALGIIGANGAGKTTVLRLLSNVTKPTLGKIEISGRIAPLIQVGAGFHPELTGKENIYLNATIMGMSKKEIDEKYDKIVAFAELEKFMDTPVKRYSSGMYVRLGFSVAVNIDPDIFLIDEILSVGDLKFQRKCLTTMSEIRSTEKSIVFISHNLGAVKGLCDRVIWINNGKIMKEGDTDNVINAYTEYMTSKSESINDLSYTKNTTRWGTGEITYSKFRIINNNGKKESRFSMGEEITIEMSYKKSGHIKSPVFWVGIIDSEENLITGFVLADHNVQNSGLITCTFSNAHMYPGEYYTVLGIFDEFRTIAYDRIGKANQFTIIDNDEKPESYREAHWKGAIKLPHKWICN